MIPQPVQEYLQYHREEKGCYCLHIDSELNILKQFGDFTKLEVKNIKKGASTIDVFPFLITESFDHNFEIPFFNINENFVCNIYFLKAKDADYIIFVDKSEIFQITQKYQQFAHEDNISKNRFKRLAEELERAKLKLNESNQQKATLIAMLSHELGTPLTSIMGYSDLLLKGEVEPDKAAKIIHSNATDLMMMIENTLSFGRSEASGQKVNYSEVEINEFIDEINATLAPILESNSLELKTKHIDSQTIVIDQPRVRQVLINLMSNAIKYTHRGHVELSFRQEANKYIFSVKDTGIGIPPDLQKAIFDPWKRVNENDTKGAGIGLIISQSLAKTMDGSVSLKYSTPAVGSVFELHLPVTKQKKTKKTVLSYEKAFNKTMVVIDDDYDLLILLEVMLLPLNVKLKVFQKLNQAKPFLEQNEVDLIITDYHIGHIRATDVIEYLNYKNLDIPVLLMTALPSEALKKSYKSSGFKDVITKPIQQETMLQSIVKNIK